MAPKPIAELAEARIKPNRELQAESDVDMIKYLYVCFKKCVFPFYEIGRQKVV